MLILAVVIALVAIANAAKVDQEVWEKLANGGRANIWVQLPNRKFTPNNPEHLRGIASRNERRIKHVKVMTEYADAMQGPITQFLTELKINFKKFWITNAFYLPNADLDIVRNLDMQFPVISEIYVEKMASIEVPVQQHIETVPVTSTKKNLAGWNIEQVNAPSAWNQGFNGTGFVVGNIDTGVRHTHVTLVSNYRGTIEGTHAYNWHDPNGAAVPFDNNGHGTHVMGSMAGSFDSGIGMSWGATWIAAKGCASSSCSQADLTSSGQFMAAPTNLNDQQPDPTKAPHVVQNSWGGGGGQTWFHPIIDSWLAEDIIPSFSAGNSGSGCGTIGSPSDYEYAISVASNDQSRSLSSFSSRGWGEGDNHPWTRQKPDISGPGSSIRSAWNTNDNAYNTISGTSMSGPHIAASTVLLLGPIGPNGFCPASTHPTSVACDDAGACLCVAYIRQLLDTTASPDYGSPAGGLAACNGVQYTAIPNYHYGWGILDVDAAVKKSLADKKAM